MITSTHAVCVVIPIHQTKLLPFEQVALNRCVEILGSHPIVLFKPESLPVDNLSRRYPQLRHESFADHFFSGVAGYNRLLLADEFYARFSAYEFMLVYQLDAFVFSDQLLKWCERGYDYIGAPWIPKPDIPSRLTLTRAAARRRIFRLRNKQYHNRPMDHHAQQHYSCGNGGFSLRRIDRMREVLKCMAKRAEPYRLGRRTPWAEDIFFSIEVNRYRRHLRIPRFETAAQFAWETFPNVASYFTDGELPFGCHAFNKLHRDDWRPIFARLGFSLDALVEKPSAPTC